MSTKTITAPADLEEAIRPKGARRARWIRYVLLLALAAGAVFAWNWWSQREAAANHINPYVTEPLQRGDISISVTATGNLEPTNEVTIGSELSGTVQEVYVDINDRVKKGQPLARLDTSKLTQTTQSSRASVTAAKAKVLQAEATLREGEASLQRQQELQRISGGKLPSKSEMDTAKATADRAGADLESAKASVLQAEAQLKSNETDLEKAIIKSPIDGIVLTRTVEPGQTVAASFTAPELFILAESLEQMELKVSVAEMDIARVEPGLTADFTVDAWPERSFVATVKKVAYGSAVVDNVVTYETQLEVTNKDLSLRPGMTAVADIHVAKGSNVFLVPNTALRFDPEAAQAQANAAPGQQKTFVQSLMPGPPRGMGGRRSSSSEDSKKPHRVKKSGESRIWVLQNGEAVPITVKVGLTDGRRTEVSGDGLSEGMNVITRANTTPRP
ncbi:HlyD family secretion protein [Roseimicrobium gellanilyticum]|uniref:HlyD family secretion protein n=1 Tax=Roseimicrobium gellanilyticum TaxID=748857 RepID=A0A366HV61_9BACT|nr:efflux RND transporter periplasmic adaptor subunit [Roseimicrobium gellanilyticum]RBP48173.1 HlyD family secretion protein [Roseimicrobium gellanilyticum]